MPNQAAADALGQQSTRVMATELHVVDPETPDQVAGIVYIVGSERCAAAFANDGVKRVRVDMFVYGLPALTLDVRIVTMSRSDSQR